ncbi:MAG: diacylglycerol kinase family protein [Thermoanaerobaculia bacterium]
MRLKLIYNPVAGRGRSRRRMEQILRCLCDEAEVDVSASRSPEDLVRIAAESSRDGFDRVVICGGDGSLNYAVREFDLERGVLGVIPAGSADDFAHVAGIPQNIRRACDAVLHGGIREVDVATANGHRYLGVAGVGFDSEVTRYANERVLFLRGTVRYLYALMRVLPKFKPRRISIGGEPADIMFAVVGNSGQYGGGIRITPAAKLDDQLLDLCIVHKTSIPMLLRTLPAAYTGAHVKSPFVECRRGETFRLESEQVMDVFADGEWLTKTPVTFGIAEQKLRLVVPGGSPPDPD